MADQAQEMKKLNKNVEDAVNMLKVVYGNSAQIKNMNEKQREAVEKWFKVTETQEENQKKQRAFTERERDEKGRFFKKQEEGQKGFMGMAKSISGIFMSMAKGIGNTFKNLVGGVTSHLKNVYSVIKGHFLSLFGEESEWFGLLGTIKDSITGFFGWFARGFIFLFKRTPKWASKMGKTLKDMYKLQVKQMKMDFLDATPEKGKKGSVWGILGLILAGIMAGVGAWLHRYLFAFSKLPIFGKIGKMFSKIKNIPFIGKMFKAIKFGFKWLGWPLTLILGIIDFIKGWKETVGDWQAKLFGGLNKAFMGILELPLDLLGWAFDKIMGFFGKESSGTGAKMKTWFSDFIDLVLKFGPIGIITDIIKGFQTGEWAGIIQKRMDKIMGIFTYVMDLVSNVWNGFLDWAIDKIKNIKFIGGPLAKTLEAMRFGDMSEPSALDAAKGMKNDGLVASHQQGEDLKKSIDDGNKAQADATTKTGQGMTALIGQNRSSGGGGASGGWGDQQQIPDELDDYILDVKNYGGDFD